MASVAVAALPVHEPDEPEALPVMLVVMPPATVIAPLESITIRSLVPNAVPSLILNLSESESSIPMVKVSPVPLSKANERSASCSTPVLE